MSLAETFSDWWQLVIIAPLGFVLHKVINHDSRISVNETKIATLEKTCEKLCTETTETNNILRKLDGRFEEHFKNN